MSNMNLTDAQWVKSSFSQQGGNCIEFAPGYAGVMPVRDSKDPEGPTLVFPADAWQAFVTATAAGEFGSI
ncbi:DUF397 domain-containing protein [Streptomyces rubellomurinus]|uniref:DUF397 domain-containing protein n=1 Tax=Streptomyces rubellomurinus (strain ATCC 31215) TaxID=359131 RepID=A0A0F2T657_STRR3|nr:DUF397 domain-containing protein [Streptomyces rubellomurinus]KJS58683.1 hypothetical protein VM95_31870 [Streptomyces rubellomurinus]